MHASTALSSGPAHVVAGACCRHAAQVASFAHAVMTSQQLVCAQAAQVGVNCDGDSAIEHAPPPSDGGGVATAPSIVARGPSAGVAAGFVEQATSHTTAMYRTMRHASQHPCRGEPTRNFMGCVWQRRNLTVGAGASRRRVERTRHTR
jgi:hypothetical protein